VHAVRNDLVGDYIGALTPDAYRNPPRWG
jgi:hypothetical protein